MQKIKIILSILVVMLLGLALGCNEKHNRLESALYFENRYSSDLFTPVVKLNLNGKVQHWIVDTGANMSLVDDSFYNTHSEDFTYLNDVDMTLNGVSGSKNYKAYYLLGELSVDSVKFNQHFLTSDLTGVKQSIKESMGVEIAGILGADYLNRYMFTVDYTNKAVYMHQIPLDTIMAIDKTYRLN